MVNNMYNLNRQNIRHNNLKTKLYIAKYLGYSEDENGDEILLYDSPKEYYFNVMPLKNASEIQEFGKLATSMKVAVITEKDKYMNEFTEMDVVYLDGMTPKGELTKGYNANYKIHAVRPQNAIIKLYLVKLLKNK